MHGKLFLVLSQLEKKYMYLAELTMYFFTRVCTIFLSFENKSLFRVPMHGKLFLVLSQLATVYIFIF